MSTAIYRQNGCQETDVGDLNNQSSGYSCKSEICPYQLKQRGMKKEQTQCKGVNPVMLVVFMFVVSLGWFWVRIMDEKVVSRQDSLLQKEIRKINQYSNKYQQDLIKSTKTKSKQDNITQSINAPPNQKIQIEKSTTNKINISQIQAFPQIQTFEQLQYSQEYIEQLIEKSDLSTIYADGNTINGITQQMHQQGIKLLQLNNNYQLKTEQEQVLLEQQHQYYNKKYQIDQLKQVKQIAFCIMVPIYNNLQYLKRNLISLLTQNYTHYTIHYLNDNPQTNITIKIQRILSSLNLTSSMKQFLQQKIHITQNPQRLYALHNIYNAIHLNCADNHVVLLVDGDDALVGRQVLGVLNAGYQDELVKPLVVYSKYLHMEKGMAALGMVSRAIRPGNFIKNRLRKQHTFCTSHLLTFSAGLFKRIKAQDFQSQSGQFFRTAYDVALVTPMLQMGYPHVKYLPQILYEYHYDGVNNDKRQQQMQVANYVFDQKQPYKRLEDRTLATIWP